MVCEATGCETPEVQPTPHSSHREQDFASEGSGVPFASLMKTPAQGCYAQEKHVSRRRRGEKNVVSAARELRSTTKKKKKKHTSERPC